MESPSASDIEFRTQMYQLILQVENEVRSQIEELPEVPLNRTIVPYIPNHETLTFLAAAIRKHNFKKSLCVDEVLVGKICGLSTLDDSDHIVLHLLGTDSYRKEYCGDVELVAYCPFELATGQMQHAAINFVKNSCIEVARVIITSISSELIFVSAKENVSIRLGVLSFNEVPLFCIPNPNQPSKTFKSILEEDPLFKNPSSIDHTVKHLLNLDSHSHDSLTFASDISTSFPKESYAASLVEKQQAKITHDLVTKGFEAINSASFLQALQYFNKALKNDSKCHKGYWGRAMTFSSEKNWVKAIEDLKRAVSISQCPEYRDDLYMCYLHYSHQLKHENKDKAIKMLRAACDLGHENPEARELLSQLEPSTSYYQSDTPMAGLQPIHKSTFTNLRTKFSIYGPYEPKNQPFKSAPFLLTKHLTDMKLVALANSDSSARQAQTQAFSRHNQNSAAPSNYQPSQTPQRSYLMGPNIRNNSAPGQGGGLWGYSRPRGQRGRPPHHQWHSSHNSSQSLEYEKNLEASLNALSRFK